jgi:hypothetical protein
MGYQNVTSARHEKFRRLSALAAAVVIGLGVGFTAPLAPASAGIASGGETSSTKAAKDTDGMIIVADKNKNKNWNKNNKNWNHKNVVVVRPYRHWNKRPYYGTVIGGVALGTVLGAAAYNAVAPAPNLCWYWANPAMTQGYWDYCN